MSKTPLVSVVTPFYNTAEYLAECIESVLAQTYPNFEYLLVDNQSTDGSDRIAADYAKRDPRIRLFRNTEFVGQVRNYNGALRHVSADAKYVKIVQADDLIFPPCLEKMVAVGEAHPSTAIISAYYLEGRFVCGSGIPWPTECIPGRTASRMHMLENFYLFGTPTTVMYRANLLAQRDPFYSETSMHEDAELCHDVLADADLGFVHDVLTFSRLGNEGILSSIESYHWRRPALYTLLRRVGPRFLSQDELKRRIRPARSEYLRILGESVLVGREPDFWDYHRRAFETVDEELPSRLALAPQIARAVVKAVARPGWLQRERARLQSRRVRSSSNGTSTPVQSSNGVVAAAHAP